MESDSYKTIKSFSQGIYKEKGSRFIAYAYPVSMHEEIKPIIEKIRKEYHEAKHHSYAYMIGPDRLNWRINDDGEPSGTAGRPILGQINTYGLTNILIVVTRYFGGTHLGISGLTNAYRTAAVSAINNADIIECTVVEYFEIRFPYIAINDVMKIVKEENLGQSDQSFELECHIKIDMRMLAREKVMNRFSRIKGLTFKYLETK